jgi:diacylglycerol diphosphate phosphatase/phosphatidate phosphatase
MLLRIMAKQRLWWSPSYLFDYACVFALALASGLLFLPAPHSRYVVPNDPTIAYPFADPDTVPTWLLIALLAIVPVAIYLAVYLFVLRNPLDLHNAYLGTLVALSLALVATESLKMSIGYKRPDYQARVASGIQSRIDDGSKSFPSGHASTSFAVFMFMFFYVAGKLRVFHTSQAHSPVVAKLVASCIVLVLPFWVSATRVYDYRHHPHDVITGACIGCLAAGLGYFVTFYPLTHADCDKPLPRVSAMKKSPSELGIQVDYKKDEDLQSSLTADNAV